MCPITRSYVSETTEKAWFLIPIYCKTLYRHQNIECSFFTQMTDCKVDHEIGTESTHTPWYNLTEGIEYHQTYYMYAAEKLTYTQEGKNLHQVRPDFFVKVEI